MSSYRVLCPHAGAIWTQALQLWDDYAQGTYTTWAYAVAPTGGMFGYKITVGLPAGGTDDYTLVDLSVRDGYQQAVSYLMQLPGWRAQLNKPYPDTLPDGHGALGKFQDLLRNFRRQIWLTHCSASPAHSIDGVGDSAFGLNMYTSTDVMQRGLLLVTDTIEFAYGTMDADTLVAYPTDGIGMETGSVVGGSSGGSVDLTPVVDALEDIATMDVEYQANNGGAVWSMRGKVRVP
jgi:hypothetical protein